MSQTKPNPEIESYQFVDGSRVIPLKDYIAQRKSAIAQMERQATDILLRVESMRMEIWTLESALIRVAPASAPPADET